MTGKLETAIDIMEREVKEALQALNQDGAEAFQKGDYERARLLMDKGPQLAAFLEKVKDLRKEWDTLNGTLNPSRHKEKPQQKQSAPLLRGDHTPEDEFLIPILQALLQLNGSATIPEVRDLVEETMQTQMNTFDYEPMRSNTGTLRWHASIQFAREAMVQEGLLSSATPPGILQITEAGKQWLAKQGIY